MIHSYKRILNLCFCCLFTQTILCSTTNINRSSEEFLSKLRSNIKLRKKYVEGKKPVEFTLLRVAGNDIDMTDLRKLNQRLSGRDEPEKQICIITLRNNCKSSSTNAENCMVRLIRGLQIHHNHNGNAILLDEVGVSIDFIKEAYISDYDKITKTTSEFYGKFIKLEEMIIDNLYMISCDAFRDILHGIIFNFLCQDLHLSGDSHSYRDSISESLIKDKHHKMIEILKSTVCSDKLMESLSSKFWYKDTESFCLYQEICKYENDNNLNFFSEVLAFDMAYSYLLKYKHVKSFKKSTKQLFMSICNVLNLDDNIKSFTTYYIDLIDQYRAVYNLLQNPVCCSSQHEENIRSFCSEDYFIRKRNDFIDRLLTDEIKILYDQTQKTTIERLKQDLMAENVTRIFYDKKLTRKTVYQLCSILQNSNAFSDFCKHQFIYINSGKGIQKGEEHTLIDRCEAILSDRNSFDSVMEIKSTVQTLNESTKTTACQIFTYTRRKTDGKIETGSKYSDLTKSFNTNMITIDKYTEPMGDTARKEHIEKCIKKYVDGVENIIFESWVITVISEHNQSLIYMITYGENDVSKERVLLIFDMPFADRPANYLDSKHSDRYIRCIEDAQEPVLHNLNDNLQALQLAAWIKLHIPNVCCALAYDYTYTEKIFKKTGFYSPKKFLYKYIWSTEMTHTIQTLCDNLSIKEFLNRQHIGRCGTKHLSSILTKFGIEKQNFDNFLFDFITNKRSSGFGHIEPAVNDECSDCCKAGICYTLQENDVMTIYTYEIKKLSPKDCATIVPAALLCKMLEYQEFSCLLKALDLTQSYNCKTTFLTLLIDAICTKILEINCLTCSNEFILPEYYCESIILECITNHRKRIVNPNITDKGKSTEPSRLYQQAFDKLINQDDIKYLAKTIFQELQILSDARVDVITSIRIDLKKLVPQSKLTRVLFTLKKKLKL